MKIPHFKSTPLLVIVFILNLQAVPMDDQMPGLYAQTTAIPDPNFEQALIDLGIDSDGTINGQVLTSDINTVTHLDVSSYDTGFYIQDLTGIQDFTLLEILDCTDNQLMFLDVSANLLLEELFCGNPSELPNNMIGSLDLSNNSALQVLLAKNIPALTSINLKNGNNAILLNLDTSCTIEDSPPCSRVCIEVDDVAAANSGAPPYTNWDIDPDATFSNDCSLGVSEVEVGKVTFYPNPVEDVVHLDSGTDANIHKVEIFDVAGKKVKTINSPTNRIPIKDLRNGLYLFKLYLGNRVLVEKMVKK